jgi:flagellar basal-body rod protein FlgF
MESPTYVALSAQMALRKQLEVVANNVANANSAGFKPDRQLFQSYVERLAVPGGDIAFVQDRATYIDRTAMAICPCKPPRGRNIPATAVCRLARTARWSIMAAGRC